jgi:hypothetical protein
MSVKARHNESAETNLFLVSKGKKRTIKATTEKMVGRGMPMTRVGVTKCCRPVLKLYI